MTSSAPTVPPFGPFIVALLAGLGWGIAAAAATGAVSLPLQTSRDLTQIIMGLPFTALAGVLAAVVALAFAVFPIGPTAAVIAWPLYRAGITSQWAYAAAGAISAAAAPAFILLLETQDSSLIKLSDFLVRRVGSANAIVATWFCVVGAFGGLMAAHTLHRIRGKRL